MCFDRVRQQRTRNTGGICFRGWEQAVKQQGLAGACPGRYMRGASAGLRVFTAWLGVFSVSKAELMWNYDRPLETTELKKTGTWRDSTTNLAWETRFIQPRPRQQKLYHSQCYRIMTAITLAQLGVTPLHVSFCLWEGLAPVQEGKSRSVNVRKNLQLQ